MQVTSFVKTFNDIVDPQDVLFEDRHDKLEQAVQTVNREIPVTELLNNGDIDETVKCLLPVVEALYDMPGLRPESGSDRWIEYMKKNIYQATFQELASFPELLKIFVKKQEKKGTDRVCACFLMLLCVCPYANVIMSLYFCACVLMLLYVCPYSICLCPYTLCVCPYAIKRMPLCYCDCVLTLSGITKVGVWGQVVLDNLCCGKTLRFCFEVVTKGQHQTDVPPLFEVRLNFGMLMAVLMLLSVCPDANMRISLCE